MGDNLFILGNIIKEKSSRIYSKLVHLGPINDLIEKARITDRDAGNAFVMGKDGSSRIMNYRDLQRVDPETIESWTYLGLFDVNA